MSPPSNERARDADRGPAAAPHKPSTGRESLLNQLRDANEQLVISSMRTQHSLADRLGFENLLSSLSDTFGRLPVADFDRAVQSGLRQIVAFLEVDGATLIEFSRNGGTARSWGSAEWMDVGEYPWMTTRLQSGHVVDVGQLEALPAEAAVDRQSYLSHRVKPQAGVPLQVEGAVVGGLVLSTGSAEGRTSAELLQQLHLFGEVFAHALSRKHVELAMQRLQEELTHVGRVSMLGEFAASLAHELNQPLAAIVANAQVALRFLTADNAVVDVNELRELLKDIETDGKRAGDIIRRLRGLIKRDDSEFSLVDLNAIVGEVAALVKNDAVARNVSMRLELAAGLPNVRGDRIQLQQLLLNLVLNGFDAMRDLRTGDQTLVISTTKGSAAGVTVAVQDSGIGIDDKDVDHIFDALYTTKPGGLGMGLAIARRIVNAHGGRLEAANNVHGGATFQLTLPAGAEDEP